MLPDFSEMGIAVIGCGSIGQRHARNLRKLCAAELLLVDPLIERAASLSDELDAAFFDSTELALAEGPEIALICAPTSMHLAVASEALRSGCHLFIEKPLAECAEGVGSLIEAAEARGRVLLVGYNFRFDPVLNYVRAWLRDGSIGKIVSARFHFGSHLPSRHPWEDYRTGYGACRELGGGVILDAIHELDMACWLFGEPETVYCAGGTFSELEINVEDTAEIVMDYPDKVVSVHLDFVGRPAERWCEIIGTEGRIQADFFAREARYFDAESGKWNEAENCGSIEETYELEMRHLLECVGSKTRPIVDGREALKSLRLAEKAKESLHTGLPAAVQIPALTAYAR